MNTIEQKAIILDNLRKLIKNDIWNIINGEKLVERDFFSQVLHFLLNNKKILLKDVVEMSKELKNRYYQILGEVEEYISQGNGEVLPALKRLDTDFTEKVLPIINEIKQYKNN